MSWWIVILCMVFSLILVEKKMRKRKRNFPPGPRGLPIIGNLHQLGPRPHLSLTTLSKKYGPITYLKLGSVPMVVASSRETVKELLKTHDLDCCSRPVMTYSSRLTYDNKDLGFSPYSDYWRDLRKTSVVELYSSKRVQSFRHIRQEEVASFVSFLKQSGLSETPVNFNRELMRLSGSVICRVGFGMNLRGSNLEDKYEEVVFRAMEVFGSFPAADFFPYFGWIIDRFTGLHAKCERVFHELDDFYEEAIKLHLGRENKDGQEDIIDLLLKMEREQVRFGEFTLTRDHIKAILVNILLAGIDTSAQTVTWAMTHLIRNPRVMEKVQDEIRERVTDKDNITEEDMEHLDYLKSVIKETLRMSPVVPLLIAREAMSDMKINGYEIPKKTRIQINAWAVHRDPDVWKDPDSFIPERFMDNKIDYKGQSYELIPFGGGRRMCPGLGLGMALVQLSLMNLLYRFDWKLPDGMRIEDVDLEESFGIVISKRVPLQLVPVLTQLS
ncbi:PREDICTED: cytochrome P450 71B11-like [Tarenaya hassleriana]|uniref:cytochrome P450 71B11-like n=1 Tax=Tarenaya hassleriana TaxID=28532 RepID=UPI00053C54C1|nr:PREDICTED: cytochrome P450 71B11-like [Tarenaya hassleriana]